MVPDRIVVPKSLICFVLGAFHFMSHAGAEKMFELIQLKYVWSNMRDDIQSFSKGCILCQIYKTANTGPNEIGTPRPVLEAGKCWQIDICSGLNSVNGKKSFLCMIDLYTGFVIPVPLKGETTVDIARIVENNLIKVFGPPSEISSDNAANLSGPAMKKLCSFYNIRYRNTVPYSPTSHALVEIANRYIVQLIRIFADQFQSQWPDVICLAALIYNSVPRPQLMGHSPFFLMFQKEPFANNEFSNVNISNLDLDDYLKRSLNDRNYVRLLRERLLKIREKRNKAKDLPYRSYPKGSLILIKDLRPKVNKKMKQIYFKLPQKVVNEYRCTVYASDIFGRIRKHSKNNIKLLSPRAAELFSKLPDPIKIILGDELDEEKWNEIRDSGVVPAYLADIEISNELGRMLRGQIPKEPHVNIDGPPQNPGNNTDGPGDEGDEDDLIEVLVSDETLTKLNELHDKNKLIDSNLNLKDIPKEFEKLAAEEPGLARRQGDPVYQLMNELDEDEEPEDDQPDEAATSEDPAGINVANILPAGTRRRVRFNIPQLNS